MYLKKREDKLLFFHVWPINLIVQTNIWLKSDADALLYGTNVKLGQVQMLLSVNAVKL